MELFDLYDDERNFTGETIERGAPLPESRYHIAKVRYRLLFYHPAYIVHVLLL